MCIVRLAIDGERVLHVHSGTVVRRDLRKILRLLLEAL
jgi:hypothetical protein